MTLALLAACLATGPALAAEDVNQAGADRIKQAIATYVGSAPFDKGVVTVTPKGDAYELKADFTALLAKFKNATVEAPPVIYHLKPMDDGRYAVTFDDSYHFKLAMDVPKGRFDYDVALEGCKSDGVFDPSLRAFAGFVMKCGTYRVAGKAPDQDIVATIKDFSVDFKSERATGGGLNAKVVESVGSFTETVKVQDATLNGDITISGDGISANISMDDFKYDAMLDLLATIVRHDSAEALKADQDAIKAALLKLLPLHAGSKADVEVKNLTVGTPFGSVKLGAFTERFVFSGLTKQASGIFGFSYDGLVLPAIVPDWVQKIAPNQGNIEFGVKDIDADGLARLAIEKFDANRTPPIDDASGPEFLKILMAGAPHFLVNPSSLATSGIDVRFEGDMSMFPTQAGKFTISSHGFDDLQVALSNSDMPDKDKAALAIAFVKGLGKTGPDGRLLWEIEFDVPNKKLIVNGQPMPVGP
jgi:hypothetical protein